MSKNFLNHLYKIFFIIFQTFKDDKEYLESIEVKTDGSLKTPLRFNHRWADQIDSAMTSKAEKNVQTSPQVSETSGEKYNADLNVIVKPITLAKVVKDITESKLVPKEVEI